MGNIIYSMIWSMPELFVDPGVRRLGINAFPHLLLVFSKQVKVPMVRLESSIPSVATILKIISSLVIAFQETCRFINREKLPLYYLISIYQGVPLAIEVLKAAPGVDTSGIASLMMPAVFCACLCVNPQGVIILLRQLAAAAW